MKISELDNNNISFDNCDYVLIKDYYMKSILFQQKMKFLTVVDSEHEMYENYTPPSGEKIDDIWNEGMGIIKEIENTLERAVVSFLFLSRVQFFEDANKRTASLFMNALLVDAGLKPLLFPQSDTQHFMEKLADF